jgi:hypothetical protein
MKIFPKTAFYVASATEQDVLNVKERGGLLQPLTRMVSSVPITLAGNQFLQVSPTTTGRILLATPVSTVQTSVPAVATSDKIKKDKLMEKDGKTRLYYHCDRPARVQEAWPRPTGWEDESWTFGQVAEETYSRADFFCVSCLESDGGGHWIVDSSNEEDEQSFNVNITSNNYDEDFAHLTQQLEERSQKKGLTIIIY